MISALAVRLGLIVIAVIAYRGRRGRRLASLGAAA